MNLNKSNLNLLWSSLIIDHLAARGIKHFFVSPGYRCAPLHNILNKRKDLFVHVVPDERSASFHALGSILSTQKPAVLISTSGTAVANYFPAVIEAYHNNLPLLLLTTDRPFDAMDVDANQSINQKNIYGTFTTHNLNLPHPNLDVNLFHLSSKINHAINQLFNNLKPVHINLPFREPLEEVIIPIPESYLSAIGELESRQMFKIPEVFYDFNKEYLYELFSKSLSQNSLDTTGGGYRSPQGRKVSESYEMYVATNDEELDDVDGNFGIDSKSKKPLVVVGQLGLNENLEKIKNFIKEIRCPLFIDITSSLKYKIFGENIITYLDHPVSMNFIEKEYKPDLILHLGGRLVSNNYYRMLKRNNFYEVQVAPTLDNLDQASRVIHHIPVRVDHFCEKTNLPTLKNTTIKFKHFDLTSYQNNLKLNHVSLVNKIVQNINNDDLLYIGNSFPIRAFDQYYFGPKTTDFEILTHRGVSGIEGFVAAARGAHLSSGKRVILVLGDISFIHDFSSLLYLKEVENIKIIVVNNNRGGIFSTLPIKKDENSFNDLIETPHNIKFYKLLENYPFEALYANDIVNFEEMLKKMLDHKSASILEVQINHEEDIQNFEYIKSLGN